jgi:hypothetical protein
MPEVAIGLDARNARTYDLENVANGMLLTTPVLAINQHVLAQNATLGG